MISALQAFTSAKCPVEIDKMREVCTVVSARRDVLEALW